MIRRVRARGALATTIAIVALAITASPAAAVTPRPTNDRSHVVSIDGDPATAVAARVVGGDSLVEITVAPGHEVVVLDYAGGPYLRVERGGEVQENQASAAVSLNRTRDALSGGAPATTDESVPATGAPDWRPHGSGGRAAWHDHRIHVGPGAPVAVPIDWRIPITVDGQDAAIVGRLERLPAPSPLPYLLGAALVAGLVWVIGQRRPFLGSAVALAIGSTLAAVTGFVEWRSLPATVPRNLGLVVVPAAAAIAIGVAAAASRQRVVRLVASAGAVALLAGWLAFRWSILTNAVLISTLTPTIDRVSLSIVLGTTLGAAGLVVTGAGVLPVDDGPAPSRAVADP